MIWENYNNNKKNAHSGIIRRNQIEPYKQNTIEELEVVDSELQCKTNQNRLMGKFNSRMALKKNFRNYC